MKFKVEPFTYNCIEWIRDYFEKNGKNCNAIVGISGGKDSSVVANLCVEALGKERVIGVTIPNGVNKFNDFEDVDKIVKHLGIELVSVDILTAYNSIICGIQSNFRKISISESTKINLPPRLRMSVLYAIAQSTNGRVANTCNLSENVIGYSTRWGDSIGDFSPIANFTSTEVVKIGKYLGIPDSLINKVPSDGLCGKTDEENFGFTYKELDDFIRNGFIDNIDNCSKMVSMFRRNEFKQKSIPSFTTNLTNIFNIR